MTNPTLATLLLNPPTFMRKPGWYACGYCKGEIITDTPGDHSTDHEWHYTDCPWLAIRRAVAAAMFSRADIELGEQEADLILAVAGERPVTDEERQRLREGVLHKLFAQPVVTESGADPISEARITGPTRNYDLNVVAEEIANETGEPVVLLPVRAYETLSRLAEEAIYSAVVSARAELAQAPSDEQITQAIEAVIGSWARTEDRFAWSVQSHIASFRTLFGARAENLPHIVAIRCPHCDGSYVIGMTDEEIEAAKRALPAQEAGIVSRLCDNHARWLRDRLEVLEDFARTARAIATTLDRAGKLVNRDLTRPPLSVKWWLVELDVHGNPTLADGSHDDARGAHHAAYLHERLGFSKGKRMAVARIEVMPAVPDATGTNEETLSICAAMLARATGGTQAPADLDRLLAQLEATKQDGGQ